METRLKLTCYQKGILIVMILMSLVFALLYRQTISRVGFEYRDTIFVPSEDQGNTIYSGKLQGQSAQFTVSADKTVVFQHGDTIYGPYTAIEDPTAIPEDKMYTDDMTGIELWQGTEILFRGGATVIADKLYLYDETPKLDESGIFYVTHDSVMQDDAGNVVDPLQPTAFTILNLMGTPKLIHHGTWRAWFTAVLLCVFNALSMIFADAWFRFSLSFQIRNADHAEPSNWEIIGRYIGWTVLTIGALIIFITGLQ